MIRITICDDDKIELKEIETMVCRCLVEQRVEYRMYTFSSPENMLYEMSDNQISDIYILDVSMPEKDGFSVADEVRKLVPNAVIIFLTSHSELASVGYLYDAHRYVIKLRMEQDLPEAITSALHKLPALTEKSIVIRHYNDAWKIPYSNIVSVTRIGRQLEILTLTQGTVLDRRGIKELFDLLNDSRFLFIDRSCFINIDFTAQFTGSSIKLSTGHSLPISRRSMQSVRDAILHRWGE